jgi:hypothetical protein
MNITYFHQQAAREAILQYLVRPDEGKITENKYTYDLDEPLGCDPK